VTSTEHTVSASTIRDSTQARAPHVALYRRWRAQKFGDIVGQGAVVETLRNAVRLDRVAHGLLFVGPRGTGKTSMARIVAKAINCPNLRDGEPCDACPSCEAIREGRALDVVEMDAASNNRVDDMRELLPRVYTAPADLRRKVFIVDEVQRIKEGWDVLLKTLEEPPDNVLFIFCTTNPSQIRPAVVSRLQRYTFRPLTVEEIAGKLVRILEGDGRSAEPAAVRLVAELAAGGMRDAESMLDQLLSTASDPLTGESVRELLGLADESAVDAFVDALSEPDALAGIAVLDRLEASGRDLVTFADQVVSRLRQVLVARLAGRPGPTRATASASPGTLARVARRLTGLDSNRPGAGGYRFQLELALLHAAAEVPEAETGAAAERRTGTDVAAEEGGRTRAAAERSNGTPAGPDAATETGEVAVEPATTELARDAASAAAEMTPQPDAPAGAVSVARASASTTERPAHGGTVPGPRGADSAAEPDAPAGDSTRDVATPGGESGDGASEGDRTREEALERLRRGWPQVVAHVARNPANRPLIVACRPVEVQERVVVLGFPEDQAFLRDIAERKRGALEEGVRVVLGSTYVVRCVATNVDALTLPGEEAIDLVEHAKRIFEGDIADVAEIS
jgi:DNA polymerase-3 subunit gamma/tau